MGGHVVVAILIAFVMVRATVQLVYDQLMHNSRYAIPYALNGVFYWVLRYARGGKNLELLQTSGSAVMRRAVSVACGYWDRVVHLSLYAGGLVGSWLGSISEKVCGHEGIGGAISLAAYMVPIYAISGTLLYLLLFPAAYAAFLPEIFGKARDLLYADRS